MLLHRVGDELKEVATGLILKTGSELMHHAPVDKGFMKVKVVTVPKVYHNMDPPVQPLGADEHVVLGKCPEWVFGHSETHSGHFPRTTCSSAPGG